MIKESYKKGDEIKKEVEVCSDTMDNKDITGSINGSQTNTNTYDKTFETTNPMVEKRNSSSLLPDIAQGRIIEDDYRTGSIIKVRGQDLSDDETQSLKRAKKMIEVSPYNARRKKSAKKLLQEQSSVTDLYQPSPVLKKKPPVAK